MIACKNSVRNPLLSCFKSRVHYKQSTVQFAFQCTDCALLQPQYHDFTPELSFVVVDPICTYINLFVLDPANNSAFSRVVFQISSSKSSMRRSADGLSWKKSALDLN